MITKGITFVGLLLLASAPVAAQTIVAAAPHTSNVNGFIVTEGDISDRPYTVIGSVSAKVGKLTWVSQNPNTDMVDSKLRREGQKLGADAVVRVRYSPTGASMMSWGGMKAEGTAIKYVVQPPTP
jgi:uncharacterized protein YbjQ (UPF0145 family)